MSNNPFKIYVTEIDGCATLIVRDGGKEVSVPMIGFLSIFDSKYYSLLEEFTDVVNISISKLKKMTDE